MKFGTRPPCGLQLLSHITKNRPGLFAIGITTMLAGRESLGWGITVASSSAAAVAGNMPAPATRLEPDAIGVAQDTVIGMASSAPAATVGLVLAGLAVATAHGSGPILIVTAIPMLIIANAYRRCNMWNANCGASFEWVGRAINPYLGFLTGWLMVVAYIIGTVAEILLLGPSVLAVFGSTSTNAWAWIVIGSVVGVVMLVIAVVGIKITAKTQVGMALVEYLILMGLAVAGLVFVLGHHPGTLPITRGWFSLSGIDGNGNAVAGFLIAVFVYGGWDGTLYVNEEVKRRQTNPGRAAIVAVGFLAVLYTLAQVGPAGRGVSGEAAGQLGVRAGVRGAGARRRILGQEDGAVHRPVRGRDHRHRHRAQLPDRLRHGQLPGPAGLPVQRVQAVPHPGGGQYRGRHPADRADLGVPAGHDGAERVQRRDRGDRAAVRDLLHHDRAGHHGVLPAAGLRQRQGRADPGPAAARRRRVPRLDAGPVGAGGAGGPGQVPGRHRRDRAAVHALRAVRAALPVLRHQAGARHRLRPGLSSRPWRPGSAAPAR